VAAARPAEDYKNIGFVRSDVEYGNNGFNRFHYEQTDGQSREESISLKEVVDAEVPEVKHTVPTFTGSYEYVDANGVKMRVSYTADEHGFLPKIERI
jgi:hypothetical protein